MTRQPTPGLHENFAGAAAMTDKAMVTGMVDAAMVEMSNIHPPLKRSECERLIRAALATTEGSDNG